MTDWLGVLATAVITFAGIALLVVIAVKGRAHRK